MNVKEEQETQDDQMPIDNIKVKFDVDGVKSTDMYTSRWLSQMDEKPFDNIGGCGLPLKSSWSSFTLFQA